MKVYASLARALSKSPDQARRSVELSEATHRVEEALYGRGQDTVSSAEIGELALEQLRSLDPLAAVRFAMVYHHIGTLDDLKALVADLERDNSANPL
jgi:transcriptional regulator NrdR family protein